jgi:four helix bundle protein
MSYNSQFSLDSFELYNSARRFRVGTYRLIRQLPAEEKYCLGTQMRRAAVSVTNNIAEGHGRWYYKENIRFCRVARGSIGELIDDFNVCLDERYGDTALVEELQNDAQQLIARINSYVAYLRRSKQGELPDVEQGCSLTPLLTYSLTHLLTYSLTHNVLVRTIT